MTERGEEQREAGIVTDSDGDRWRITANGLEVSCLASEEGEDPRYDEWRTPAQNAFTGYYWKASRAALVELLTPKSAVKKSGPPTSERVEE